MPCVLDASCPDVASSMVSTIVTSSYQVTKLHVTSIVYSTSATISPTTASVLPTTSVDDATVAIAVTVVTSILVVVISTIAAMIVAVCIIRYKRQVSNQ